MQAVAVRCDETPNKLNGTQQGHFPGGLAFFMRRGDNTRHGDLTMFDPGDVQFVLANDQLGCLSVDLMSFLEFDIDMDGDLRQLVREGRDVRLHRLPSRTGSVA